MVILNSNKQVDDLLAQAEQFAQKLDWFNAANKCQEALTAAPENKVVLDKLGWYLSRSKQYDEAIKVYEKLSTIESNMAKWFYMAGYQYYDQQKWKNAIIWFDQALSRYENYLKVLYRKGYAHTKLNDNEVAIDTFQKCINAWKSLSNQDKEKEKSTYADACFQLGKIYLSNGLTLKAEPILAEAIKFDSKDGFKHYEYGKALQRNQKPEQALIQLQEADTIERGKDFIIALTALVLIDLNQIDNADKTLMRIPERSRKEYVWRAISKVRLAQGKSKEAINTVNKGIKLDSKNHNAHLQLALAYIADNNYAQAHSALLKAIDLRRSIYNLDFPEAQQKLNEVLEHAKSINIDLSLTEPKLHEASSMGIITKYNNSKGFGFIKRTNGESDLFFHISGVLAPKEIEVGRGVNFEVENSPKGQRAINIMFV